MGGFLVLLAFLLCFCFFSVIRFCLVDVYVVAGCELGVVMAVDCEARRPVPYVVPSGVSVS